MSTPISHNPATGERIRWHVRSADSGGRLARLEMWCAAGGGVPHLHVHPRSEERFEVLEGRVEVQVGPRTTTVGPGEDLVLPAGVPHRWTVTPDAEAHFFVDIDEPGHFEEQIETMFALGRQGALDAAGKVDLLLAACVSAPHLDDVRLASPPVAVQRALFAVLTRVAGFTGHRATVDAARAEARRLLAALDAGLVAA